MKPFAVLVVLLSSLLVSAQEPAAAKPATPAAQPASADDINRLVEVMHMKRQMTEMQRTMLDQYKPMMEKMSGDLLRTLTPQQRQKFQDIMNDMMAESLHAYPPDEMIGDMTPIYRKYLDKPDIEAMIAFYASPTGQKVLEMQPKIIRDFMSVMMPKMQDRMQVAIARMQDRIRELAAESQPAPAQDKDFKPATPAPK